MTDERNADAGLSWRIDGDRLMRFVGEYLLAHGDGLDPTLAEWMVEDARARMTPAERAESKRIAREAVARVTRRVRARSASARLVPHRMVQRDATVVGDVRETAPLAAGERCVGWLGSSAVAAGVGRELWDEPCDTWLELPETIPPGNQIALPVTGDSMEPVLVDGDGIIVDLDARARTGTIVVARHPENGYVVKCVSQMSRSWVELESFNPAYPSFRLRRTPGTIVGVVIARVRRDDDAG
jgi:SOS-response transcriptional repressor LexA